MIKKTHSNHNVLQQVVFPYRKATTLLPLYFGITGTGHEQYLDQIKSRTGFELAPGQHISFAAYYNAFPASYYAFHTELSKVYFDAEIEGKATVRIFESFIDGASEIVAEFENDTEISQELSLEKHEDGGWFWFDITADGSNSVTLKSAAWSCDVDWQEKNASIAICTMNKPNYVVDQLKNIAERKDEATMLKKIVIVDQGSNLVKEHKDFKKTAEKLDGRVVTVEQANLGGSGGFSRGMYEGAYTYGADFVLLLDDDTFLETASLDRIITFASLCKDPTIVGGHMFWMDNLPTLNGFSEDVNISLGNWGSTDGTKSAHNFTNENLTEMTWIHKRYAPNYTGWWMCLIPSEIIKKIGLSLPMFIKWDDTEYALRAAKFGYNTVSFPTAFVWHESWLKKDDAIDWTGFYHARNRLVTALLYNKEALPVKFIVYTGLQLIKDLMYMRYSLVDLKLQAAKSIMEGPKAYIKDLPDRLDKIKATRAMYTDSDVKPLEEFPKTIAHREEVTGSLRENIPLLIKGVFRQVLPVNEDSKKRPDVYIGVRSGRILRLLNVDSAVFSYSDGVKGAMYVRDRSIFSKQLLEIIRVYGKLFLKWPVLKGRFKAREKQMSSVNMWKKYFGK